MRLIVPETVPLIHAHGVERRCLIGHNLHFSLWVRRIDGKEAPKTFREIVLELSMPLDAVVAESRLTCDEIARIGAPNVKPLRPSRKPV